MAYNQCRTLPAFWQNLFLVSAPAASRTVWPREPDEAGLGLWLLKSNWLLPLQGDTLLNQSVSWNVLAGHIITLFVPDSFKPNTSMVYLFLFYVTSSSDWWVGGWHTAKSRHTSKSVRAFDVIPNLLLCDVSVPMAGFASFSFLISLSQLDALSCWGFAIMGVQRLLKENV